MKRLALNTWTYGLLWAAASPFVSLPLSYGFFDLSIMGGPNISHFDASPSFSASSSSALGLGVGALVNLDLMPLIGLESGLFYQQHKTNLTNINNSNRDGSVQINQWSVPIMLRVQPLPYIAVEGGVYVGLGATSTVTLTSVGTVQGAELANGHGLIVGASLMLPLMPALNFRLSGFYEQGLSNLATDGSTVHARNLDILTGLMFDL
jgi:hypothetical protein